MDRGARTRPAPAWSKNSNVDPESRQGLRYICQTGTLVPHRGTGWRSVDVCRAADGRRAWDALPVRARWGCSLFHANDKWRRECRGISQSIQLGSKTALISTRNCNQVEYDCGLVGDTNERLGCLAVGPFYSVVVKVLGADDVADLEYDVQKTDTERYLSMEDDTGSAKAYFYPLARDSRYPRPVLINVHMVSPDSIVMRASKPRATLVNHPSPQDGGAIGRRARQTGEFHYAHPWKDAVITRRLIGDPKMGFGLRAHAALGRDGCHPILTTANQELEHSLRYFPFWSLSDCSVWREQHVERPPPSSEFRYVEYVQKACVRIKERSKIVDRNCVQQRLVGSGVSGGHSPVASKAPPNSTLVSGCGRGDATTSAQVHRASFIGKMKRSTVYGGPEEKMKCVLVETSLVMKQVSFHYVDKVQAIIGKGSRISLFTGQPSQSRQESRTGSIADF
ncbi:hypothetical protein NEUTE1DRAFT_101797 [Neurospora tetrasperma FGSC 2508]|uniref:Uncharacterized protein n=1 Tax=Neurospora tetrasperma (strain FGSC 2508 / ATCC MYA-4615 / P0657) TaxID=510951 RepID=F8MQ87_NEUT8|nr:uncharacterized protein NEUTE1DRAFT_101797 [Neurospora tetrasperma FGSC 2508]EGO56517.1 hypothetical protein NEUTE1DRAFT_101797 [Neurospora tetrasperma FGSC 2508]